MIRPSTLKWMVVWRTSRPRAPSYGRLRQEYGGDDTVRHRGRVPVPAASFAERKTFPQSRAGCNGNGSHRSTGQAQCRPGDSWSDVLALRDRTRRWRHVPSDPELSWSLPNPAIRLARCLREMNGRRSPSAREKAPARSWPRGRRSTDSPSYATTSSHHVRTGLHWAMFTEAGNNDATASEHRPHRPGDVPQLGFFLAANRSGCTTAPPPTPTKKKKTKTKKKKKMAARGSETPRAIVERRKGVGDVPDIKPARPPEPTGLLLPEGVAASSAPR